MRIALFGGTFDPPHLGHVAIARAAADRFALDTVLFAPAGRQPLKSGLATATYQDRLAMVSLACAADPRFTPSDIDAPYPDGTPNYTVLALTRRTQLHPSAHIFALVGADSFRTLAHWHQSERLLALAEWIVVSRPGFPLNSGSAIDPEGLTLTPQQRARIHLLDSVHEDIAATNLRERLHAGDSCAKLLPPGVADYILQRRLYQPPPA
jgi:nicotinate-nucleotide adenylyltransferase